MIDLSRVESTSPEIALEQLSCYISALRRASALKAFTMPFSVEHRIELGTRLRALRRARGLSADTVACQALGFHSPHHAAVTRLERGVLKQVPREHVLRLSAFYGVPVASVLPSGVTLEDLAATRPVLETPHSASTTATTQESDAGEATIALATRDTSVREAPPATVQRVEPVKTAVAELPAPSLQARLRQLRAQMGVSSTVFAQRLNTRQAPVTERDVRDWESAARRPNQAQFEALERVTGASITWMKTGRTETPAHA